MCVAVCAYTNWVLTHDWAANCNAVCDYTCFESVRGVSFLILKCVSVYVFIHIVFQFSRVSCQTSQRQYWPSDWGCCTHVCFYGAYTTREGFQIILFSFQNDIGLPMHQHHWWKQPHNQDPWPSFTCIILLCKMCYISERTVYPKKYAHGFVVLYFVVVTQSFIMNSHEVFIHIHQGCFAGTGAIVRLPQCQWSKPDGYGKISQCITTTKHSKAKTVCIFLGIYCMLHEYYLISGDISIRYLSLTLFKSQISYSFCQVPLCSLFHRHRHSLDSF